MDRQVLIPVDLDPASLTLPGPDMRLLSLNGETMGTRWAARFYGTAEAELENIRTALEEVFSAVIADFSNWDQASFISQFNRAEAGTEHTLSAPLAAMVQQAITLAEQSDGAFNPCLGEHSPALVFNRGETGETPARFSASPDTLNQVFDSATNRLTQPGGLALDLSATAKGYAVDQMAACLRGLGITSFLAEIGGEFFGEGIKADGTPWWVELKSIAEPHIAAACGLAVATSGLGERYYQIGSERFSHIAGTPGDLLAVTVLAESCADADGWATALLAAGKEKAISLAAQQGIAALLVPADGAPHHSPALESMMQ